MDIDIDIEYTVIFLYVMLTLMTKSEFRNARAVAEKTTLCLNKKGPTLKRYSSK